MVMGEFRASVNVRAAQATLTRLCSTSAMPSGARQRFPAHKPAQTTVNDGKPLGLS